MRVERAYWRAALKSLADDQLLWLALRDATEDEVAALQEALELSDEDVAASRCGGRLLLATLRRFSVSHRAAAPLPLRGAARHR